MTTFTARTPVDLIALVPYVLGFHPEESVVLLTVGAPAHGDGNFHARVDLPADPDEQRAVTRMLRDVVAQHRADAVGVLVYTGDAVAASRIGGLLLAGFAEDDVQVLDALRVDGERFYPVDEPDDEGFAYDLDTHPFTVRQVADGRVVHATREALRASLVGTDEADRAAIDTAATVFVDELVADGRSSASLHTALVAEARWFTAHVAEARRSREPLPVADAARLLVLVAFESVREVAWAPMDREHAGQDVALWQDLLRRAPAGLRAGAGGVLAFAAWLAGDGALAWCAVERALEDDPDDRLARRVAMLLEHPVPPHAWTPTSVEELPFLAEGEAESGAGSEADAESRAMP